ncbi:MAG: sensor histidine kinase [Bryobacteraceae bacterium]
MAAAVSHELKTPLSSMRLLVDTLLDEPAPADSVKTHEYLALISRENARLSRLIENFLMFSRIERNQYVCRLEETQPAGVVRGALDAIGEKLQEYEVDVDVAPGLPAIRADVGALVAVLVNLLDNAFKYTAENKQIRVRAFSNKERVCFQVADNGIGLAPKEVKKIFRKFYRVDQRLARRAGGCGLGLAIVDFIVSAHVGSIEVESRPGAGTAFTVSVPRGAESVA